MSLRASPIEEDEEGERRAAVTCGGGGASSASTNSNQRAGSSASPYYYCSIGCAAVLLAGSAVSRYRIVQPIAVPSKGDDQVENAGVEEGLSPLKG